MNDGDKLLALRGLGLEWNLARAHFMRVVLHYVIITFWFNRFSVDRDYISEVTLTLFSPKADAANMKPNEKGVMSM